MIDSTAWVLHSAAEDGPPLRLGKFQFPDLREDEVLAEPLIGCWEGNMSHAFTRTPVDVCRERREPRVVIGNAGVVRVLKPGAEVSDLKEGDLCLVFCNGVWDRHGFPIKIYGYDAPGSVGLLSKRTKLNRRQLIPLPRDSRYSIRQWAAFSLRYITAWENWQQAKNCFRSMLPEKAMESLFVWGWGGGVTFAELCLAKRHGCDATMIASMPERLQLLKRHGIRTVDRRLFSDLSFCPKRYAEDSAYKERYLAAERLFLERVRRETNGEGVSIFIDYIGEPVYRATVKALARPGVVTTAGWKEGMRIENLRALECMNWHAHVHTHYARYEAGLEAVQYAEANGWVPPAEDRVWPWECVEQLASVHSEGRVESFFPLYAVNA
jgi:NADPH:quinone reductase-like Zn-dependent oxidoreductase